MGVRAKDKTDTAQWMTLEPQPQASSTINKGHAATPEKIPETCFDAKDDKERKIGTKGRGGDGNPRERRLQRGEDVQFSGKR